MRYYADPQSATTYANGSVRFLTPGPFSSIAKVEHCPLPCGARRTVHATGEPDTAFSLPATVRILGKHIAGFLSFNGEHDEGGEGWVFHPYRYGKNYPFYRAYAAARGVELPPPVDAEKDPYGRAARREDARRADAEQDVHERAEHSIDFGEFSGGPGEEDPEDLRADRAFDAGEFSDAARDRARGFNEEG